MVMTDYVFFYDLFFFFFSSRRRHTRCSRDWSSDVCSSDLVEPFGVWRSTRTTLAGSMGNDHQELSSGTFSLVRQFEKKCRPTRVVHRFRQHASAQAFHLQVFDNDYSVFLDDLPRQLEIGR